MTTTTAEAAPKTTTRLSWIKSAATSELAPIWIAGILIRLLLMPVTVHSDIYSIYSRSYDAVSTGHWFSFSSQIVIQMAHNAWFALIQPLMPNSHGIWSPTAGDIGVGVQPEDLTRFLAYPHLARALFLMKLPYLAADLATGYVMIKLVEPCWRRRILALWLLNPIVIFVSAVFGRHDSISIAIVMLSTLFALQGRRYVGVVLLGLGSAARFFPAFLAPFYAFAFRRTRRELYLLLGGLIGFWLVIELTVIAATGNSPTFALINRYPHVEYLFGMSVDVGGGDSLFIFPFAYAMLFLWFVHYADGQMSAFIPVASTVMLVLFGFTYFNPQYAIWIVPYLILAIYHDGRLIFTHAVQILLLGLLALQWGAPLTWDLFQPLLGEHANTLPGPMNVIGAFIPANIYLGVVRTLFTAVSLWLGFQVMRRWHKSTRGLTTEELSNVAD
ncbi:MAG: hypothetical protein WBW04_08775 [Nitrolancea sp.]